MMVEWRKPEVAMTNYRHTVIKHTKTVEDAEGLQEEVDAFAIFWFDGFQNRFVSMSNHEFITYNEVIGWLPLPND